MNVGFGGGRALGVKHFLASSRFASCFRAESTPAVAVTSTAITTSTPEAIMTFTPTPFETPTATATP